MKHYNRHAKWTTAITFAEAGEWETAILYMPPIKTTLRAWLEKTFMAIAFSEGGMAEEALRLTGNPKRRKCGCCETFLATIGLNEVSMTFGLMPTTQLAVRH